MPNLRRILLQKNHINKCGIGCVCVLSSLKSERMFTCKCLRKIGKSANHSTAKAVSPNTPMFVSKRDANITEANIAALVDRDPGNLETFIYLMLNLFFKF